MVEISKLPPRTGQPSDAASVQEHLSWLQSGGGQCLRGDGRTW